jgi:5-(carboxyamino)imidazole ribonucleotide synthase
VGVIGILGAGQLGRMLALAGYPLGLRFRFLDPAVDATAGLLAEQRVADYTDPEALQDFAKGLALATYEFENVPVTAARLIEQFATVFPPPKALETAQDRLHEKKLFQSLEIPAPDFVTFENEVELTAACEALGFPVVLKTRRWGYDGKGQVVLRSAGELDEAWGRLQGGPWILEKYVPFERELSILSCRGWDGGMVFYPLVENWHAEGILRLSLAPARAPHPSCSGKLKAMPGRSASGWIMWAFWL